MENPIALKRTDVESMVAYLEAFLNGHECSDPDELYRVINLLKQVKGSGYYTSRESDTPYGMVMHGLTPLMLMQAPRKIGADKTCYIAEAKDASGKDYCVRWENAGGWSQYTVIEYVGAKGDR